MTDDLTFGHKPTIRELASQAGVAEPTVHSRLRAGKTLAEALVPTPTSIAARAREYGLNPTTVRARIRTGMTLDEALTLQRTVAPEYAAQKARNRQLRGDGTKYVGRSCKLGHRVRYINNNNCVECQSLRKSEKRRDKA